MKAPKLFVYILGAIGMLCPPVIALCFVYRYAVNVPFWDEWDLVPFILKLHAGTVSLADFWVQHTDNRLVMLKIIISALEWFTHYNVIVQMYVGIGVNVISLLAIWKLLFITLRPSHTRLALPLAVVASALMFSAVQYENWLWAMTSLQWYVLTFCATVTAFLWALWPSRWPAILGTLLLTFVGALSISSGMLLWGACLLGIVLSNIASRRWPRWPHLVAWALVGFVISVIYLVGYQKPPHEVTVFFVQHPTQFMRFFLVCLGAPLSPMGSVEFSTITGCVGVVMFSASTWWLARHSRVTFAKLLPWFLIVFYFLATIVVIAAGRSALGLIFAEAPRYTAASTLFWLGVIVVSAVSMHELSLKKSPSRRLVIPVFLGVVVMLGYGYERAYARGLEGIRKLYADHMIGLAELYDYESAPDETLKVLYPRPARLRQYARQLKSLNLGPFFGGMSESKRHIIETWASKSVSTGDGYLDGASCDRIVGWAWNNQLPNSPIRLDIYDGNTRLTTTAAWQFRKDLLEARIGNGRHGFTYNVPSPLKDGRSHTIHVRISGTNRELQGSPVTLICACRENRVAPNDGAPSFISLVEQLPTSGIRIPRADVLSF
jgi:hypothetical protein